MSLDPADPWREWAFGEFLTVAGHGQPEEAYAELAERCGLPSLADPFVYGVGGLYGVVVLAAELLPLGVAQFVADAREMASLRAPFWGGTDL